MRDTAKESRKKLRRLINERFAEQRLRAQASAMKAARQNIPMTTLQNRTEPPSLFVAGAFVTFYARYLQC